MIAVAPHQVALCGAPTLALFALIASCAHGQPPPAPAPPAPPTPVVAVAPRPAFKASDTVREWKATRPLGVTFDPEVQGGPFRVLLARWGGPHSEGLVLTESGALRVPDCLSVVLPAANLDGDGAPNLLLQLGVVERWASLAVVRSTPNGPALMPLADVAPRRGRAVLAWTDDEGQRAVSMMDAGNDFRWQILAFRDGALRPKRTVAEVRFTCEEGDSHLPVQRCNATATAHGTSLEVGLPLVGSYSIDWTPGGDLLWNLHGHGARYLIVTSYGFTTSETEQTPQTKVILELRPEGWLQVPSVNDVAYETMQDADGDGLPEFLRGFGTLTYGVCKPRQECGKNFSRRPCGWSWPGTARTTPPPTRACGPPPSSS